MAKIYLNSLDPRKAQEIDYKFELPVFGKSNTDQSFYEPQSTRIANMKKSATFASRGVYDFDENSKSHDIENFQIPVGRKLGILPEEISQIETINNQNIKNQADEIIQNKKNKKESEDSAKALGIEIAKSIDSAKYE